MQAFKHSLVYDLHLNPETRKPLERFLSERQAGTREIFKYFDSVSDKFGPRRRQGELELRGNFESHLSDGC